MTSVVAGTHAPAPSEVRLGIVVIGRNEGERLSASLRAARITGVPVVYADSGSSDGSRELANAEGAVVVPIEGPPYTAARGRNAGMERLFALHPHVIYVQFVDGDTVLGPGWLPHAVAVLDRDPRVSAVCGHLRERGAETCVWRRLMQMEWQGPTGDISACGGIAMYRRAALEQVGRFRESLVGGEEPELCERLRAAGGRIVRIDAAMGVHDSAIDSLRHWWSRAARVGSANAALLADRHARQPLKARRAVRSALVWGLALPFVMASSGIASMFDVRFATIPAVATALYCAQIARIALRLRGLGMSRANAWLYAAFCVIDKLPLAQGWLRYWTRLAIPGTCPVSEPQKSRTESEAHS